MARFRVEIVKVIYVRGVVNSEIGFQFHVDNPQNLTINYNIMFGIIGLVIMPIFRGGSLTYVIDLSYSFCDLFALLFKILTLFVVFIGGWLGYEMAGFVFGDNLFSMRSYGASSYQNHHNV